MPSPFGEGQADTPINHHNLGEVPSLPRLDLPSSTTASSAYNSYITLCTTAEKSSLP
jgi:hypothetical protein